MEKNKRIALIGMPGCGKSTVGEILAIKLNKKLIDLDDYIIKREEKSIDELFEIGEYFFREAETRALKKVATEENVILSTGGGIIKEKENSNILGKNFIVVFIDRPIDNIYSDIESSTRPLLKDNKDRLSSLYKERYYLYKKYCDIHIYNDSTLEKVVDNIIKEIKAYRTF